MGAVNGVQVCAMVICVSATTHITKADRGAAVDFRDRRRSDDGASCQKSGSECQKSVRQDICDLLLRRRFLVVFTTTGERFLPPHAIAGDGQRLGRKCEYVNRRKLKHRISLEYFQNIGFV
jgi:hypothetical protein